MQISDRLLRLKPSQTLVMNAKAIELKAKGVKVVSLAVGEPDFPTPGHICEAAKKAIDEGFTRYTVAAGIVELRRAVGGYLKSQYGLEIGPENVLCSAGGKHALFNYMLTVLNPGDEAIVPAPYWVSYPDMLGLAGAKTIVVSAGVEDGFKLDPKKLERAITPRTRLLVLNSPCNPTGAVYSESELAAIMDVALGAGLMVIADELDDLLVFPPARMASGCPWMAKYPEQVSILGGVSKSFAMTGWRMGYLVSHPDIVKKATTLQGQSTSNISSITQKAALAALTGGLDCVEGMRAAFRRRRDLALDIIGGWPFARCPRPDGAFYLFVDVHKCYGSEVRNSGELCQLLLEEGHVATTPGVAFGDDRCVRLSYAVSDETLREGLEVMGRILSRLAEKA